MTVPLRELDRVLLKAKRQREGQLATERSVGKGQVATERSVGKGHSTVVVEHKRPKKTPKQEGGQQQ